MVLLKKSIKLKKVVLITDKEFENKFDHLNTDAFKIEYIIW